MISTVNEYISEVYDTYNNWKTLRHLFFRGHSNSDFKLIPSIFRNPNYNEKELVLDFKQNAQAHTIKYDFIKERHELLVDMQYYGIPTRLLNWTFAPLNALFFACYGDQDCNGEVIILNPSEYWSVVAGKNTISSNPHSIHVISRALLSGKWSFDEISVYVTKEFGYNNLKPEDISKPFPLLTKNTNDNFFHQTGCFTIHGSSDSALDSDSDAMKCIHRIQIKQEAKLQILEQLNFLCVNEFTIFPDLHGMESTIP